MITKFKKIKNMAVFEDFDWDTTVKEPNGVVKNLKQVNVIYGRNYSGKTTLSRIVRAFETGVLSDKYGTPSFTIQTDQGVLTEDDYPKKKLLTRVFNEDFVKDNLQFIINPNASIIPFAVLGENNEKIEQEILRINDELGNDDDGNKTGLFREKSFAYTSFISAENAYNNAQKDLLKKKSYKAIDKKNGIKYSSNRYGNQNYNIVNLESDINKVLSDSYVSLSETDKKTFEERLAEKSMPEPMIIDSVPIRYEVISRQVQNICERKINISQKLQELLHDVALEEWVHHGIDFNKKRKTCAFCGQPLTDERWKTLFNHFDKETEILSNDIETALDNIKSEEIKIESAFSPDPKEFYSKFRFAILGLENKYKELSEMYSSLLQGLREKLEQRKKNLHIPIVFLPQDNKIDFEVIYSEYERIRNENIEYTKNLEKQRKEAQEKLRLSTVEEFVKTINYKTVVKEIEELKNRRDTAKKVYDDIQDQINQKTRQIDALRRKQNDEEKGALKINEYLKTYFGYGYLSLVAKSDSYSKEKNIYFEIERNGEKAYHLSEGEKSLIAFCYFIAKLEDIETSGKEPIIWIDDPISSLDGNHIYFMYSLIEDKIISFEQLFITTHNLEFLKYLRRLSINGHSINDNKHGCYLVVERRGNHSILLNMPNYLKKHGTEFNYWFNCIYQCAHQEYITDKNMHLFENFGNSARKFFETYLYYRYPDKESFHKHLERFFGENKIPTILVRKINDENSHADGDLENHSLPFEKPEIVEAAKLIINRLKSVDKDQYESLISNIPDENS